MEIGDAEAVLEAIRRAGKELGRAPSRAELKRLTGVSHFVVLKHFPTLRHAVEAAGFTPHIKGRRATAAELLEDYGRVARLLGRRPSRAEYVRAGRYSAGTFTQRFGGWVEAGEEWERSRGESPQIFAEKRRSEEMPEATEVSPQMNTENTDRKQERTLSDPCDQRSSVVGVERPAFILRPGQPAEIPGMRCVTEEVAAMIVGGLLGARKWRLEIGDVEFSRSPESPGSPTAPRSEVSRERARTLGTEEERTRSESPSGQDIQLPNSSNQYSAVSTQEKPQEFSPLMNTDDTDQKEPDFRLPNYQVTQLPNSADPSHFALRISPAGSDARKTAQLTQLPNRLSNEIVISRRPVRRVELRSLDQEISRSSDVLRRLNVEVISGRLRRDRPVMGPPLHAFAMTNAPCNEAGVAALFCMIAPDLGFQIEAIQSAFPDCEARRQVRPGKWQRVFIEFEYESRNFPLHHHDPSKCDMIVCWRHNWRKCPEEIEVLELRKVICIG